MMAAWRRGDVAWAGRGPARVGRRSRSAQRGCSVRAGRAWSRRRSAAERRTPASRRLCSSHADAVALTPSLLARFSHAAHAPRDRADRRSARAATQRTDLECVVTAHNVLIRQRSAPCRRATSHHGRRPLEQTRRRQHRLHRRRRTLASSPWLKIAKSRSVRHQGDERNLTGQSDVSSAAWLRRVSARLCIRR